MSTFSFCLLRFFSSCFMVKTLGCLTSIDNGEFKRYPFLSFDLTDLLKSLAEPIINGAV